MFHPVSSRMFAAPASPFKRNRAAEILRNKKVAMTSRLRTVDPKIANRRLPLWIYATGFAQNHVSATESRDRRTLSDL
jgi:hypothetical protein